MDPRPPVLRGFDPPALPFGPGHRGVDLAARAGQPVLAPGPGVVAFAGLVAGRGVVSVDHAGGLRTTYEPVTARRAVGEPVAAGAVLGLVSPGPGHCLPRTCVHWGLRRGETYLDPLGLLGVTAVRLLPVWTPSGLAPPPALAGPPTGAPVIPDRGPLLARG